MESAQAIPARVDNIPKPWRGDALDQRRVDAGTRPMTSSPPLLQALARCARECSETDADHLTRAEVWVTDLRALIEAVRAGMTNQCGIKFEIDPSIPMNEIEFRHPNGRRDRFVLDSLPDGGGE
jgi:hypothetical protein